MTTYEAVLLRFVPDQTAGELINFGVLMWLPERWELLHEVNVRSVRAKRFFPSISGAWYRRVAEAVHRRLRNYEAQRGPRQGELGAARDHFDTILEDLIRPDATMLQRSHVMTGITEDPLERLHELFEEFVLRHERLPPQRERVKEPDIERAVALRLQQAGLSGRVETSVEVHGKHISHTFPVGWVNGHLNVVEPVSFDLAESGTLREKAASLTGRLYHLQLGGKPFSLTAVVAKPHNYDLLPAFRDATAMLRETHGVKDVVSYDDLSPLIAKIEHDLAGRTSDPTN